MTDVRGRFVIPDLTRGAHTLVARKDGFEELTLGFQFLNRTDVLYVKMISFTQLLLKAEQALEEKKWDEADALLERAEKLNTSNSTLLYLRAVEAYKKDRFTDAAGCLEAILAKGGKEPYVYLFLADLYEKNIRDTKKAIENLQAYLSRQSDAEAEKRLEALKAGQ